MLIPRADDPSKLDEYVDGGVVNNAAVGVAQRVASLVQLIGVEPIAAGPDQTYADSLDLALGVFGVMQRTITIYATILAYAESILVSDDPTAAKRSGFADESLPLRIEYIVPSKALPGTSIDFNDAAAIGAMLEIGREDALRNGWQFFQPSLWLSEI